MTAVEGVIVLLVLLAVLAWLVRPNGNHRPYLDPPVVCDYCLKYLGTRSRHDGIGMRGKWFCDTACYMGAERRDLNERSLGDRG